MSGRPIAFDEAAQALFRLSGPTAVSAGAGSGKTTALVELCVRLLSGEATGEPVDPGAVVAITFTERAAEELGQRLRAAVAERARGAARVSPGSAEAQAWLDRLHGLERMATGTIHAFCGALLREHAPEAGLDPEFAVVDEERARSWLSQAARAAVVAALDAARPEARALAAGLGAGAERGGLAAVVAELVRARATRGDGGAPLPSPAPDEAVRREARGRLAAAALALERAASASRSAGAAALLDELCRPLAEVLPPRLDGAAGLDALDRMAALAEGGRARRLGRGDGEVRAARDELLEAAAALVALEADALGGPQRAELAALVADAEGRYAARKREARALDFDDLLVRAEHLLAADAALLAELRTRLRAFLVDEYQDVNPLQQRIFERIAGPGEPAGPTLVAVGDLKQSIYRFRGADVSVFARLLGAFAVRDGEGAARPGGRVLYLTRNHRSAPAVVDLVNAVSARAFSLPGDAPRREDEIHFGPEDHLVATRGEGARPACELLVDPEEGPAAERRAREAEAIARRIEAIVSGVAGIAVHEDGERGPRLRRPRHRDVAILFRRLTQLGAYERALRAAGVPYRLARGGGFFQAPEVRDLGELVATLFDPGDRMGWAAVLRSPMCLVSDATLFLLARAGLPRLARLDPDELRREVDRAAGLEPRAATRPGAPPRAVAAGEWGRLLRFLEVWRELRAVRDRLPLGELLRRAAEGVDLDAVLLAGPDGERRAVNLEKAIALAARFEADGGRPGELASHLRALAARPPREPEAELDGGDAVAVLSVHQAKGLEWPIVFVPDMGARPRHDARRAFLDADGRLCASLLDPAREVFVETAAVRAAREAERRSQAAESRRLLYVALTRARDHLVLSGEASAGSDGWRAFVDAAVADQPGLAREVPFAEAGTRAAGAPLPADAPAPAASAPSPVAPRLAGPPPLLAVRVAVTDLAEYARCPRRHHLARVLALPEPRGGARPAGDDPGRATARGTLAHAMLSETDLAAPPLERRAQMGAAAARRGHDPASPGTRRILAEVARFIESDGGRALAVAARDGRLSRELPFLLRLDGEAGTPAAYLVGALDALVAGRRGEGLTVVDYKYALPRPEAAERYRIQLLAYALAARRAHPGVRVRARLQFLRGDLRAVDVTPSVADLDRFAREAPRLAWEAHRGAGGDLSPADVGRDEARCRAEGCGFVGRCYPARRAAPGVVRAAGVTP